MGQKPNPIEFYLSKIPEEYRNNIKFLEKYVGVRTKVSFIFPDCGCKQEYSIRALVNLKYFGKCFKCSPLDHIAYKFKSAASEIEDVVCSEKGKYGDATIIGEYNGKPYYRCNYCGKPKYNLDKLKVHIALCRSCVLTKLEGANYVICKICGLHAKSLGSHVHLEHGICPNDYKKKYGQIICEESRKTYNDSCYGNLDWIRKAREKGEDLTDKFKETGKRISKSIMSNPEERKRRSELIRSMEITDEMRKIYSETAKKTSARKDIQESRTLQLKNWRDNNSEDFYNKCVYKMINTHYSKPETVLYGIVKK